MKFDVTRKDDLFFPVIAGLIGLGLVVAPWLFGFLGVAAAAWNAWVIGVALVVVAAAAYWQATGYEPWAGLVLGLWAIAAPWALGFSGAGTAPLVHLIAGAAVAIVAAAALWFSHQSPTRAA